MPPLKIIQNPHLSCCEAEKLCRCPNKANFTAPMTTILDVWLTKPQGPLGGPVLLCSVTASGCRTRWGSVTVSPRKAVSMVFHPDLLPVEWLCCCKTAWRILDLKWAVTSCNWKCITQRLFHWAPSPFNTHPRESSRSRGFLRRYLDYPDWLNHGGALFSSLGPAPEQVQLDCDESVTVFLSLDILPSCIPGLCPLKSITCF